MWLGDIESIVEYQSIRHVHPPGGEVRFSRTKHASRRDGGTNRSKHFAPVDFVLGLGRHRESPFDAGIEHEIRETGLPWSYAPDSGGDGLADIRGEIARRAAQGFFIAQIVSAACRENVGQYW